MNVKKIIKKSVIMYLALFVFCLIGCGDSTDYTEYFSFGDAKVVANEEANTIGIDYSINNIGKKDNLIFTVSVNDQINEHAVASGETVSDTLIVDVGRLEDYEYAYEIKYAVQKKDKVIWEKTESGSCNCEPMFVHPAQITYKGETVDIELIDYQENYFKLGELFASFDPSGFHVIEIKNKLHDNVELRDSEDKKGSLTNEGGILYFFTNGAEELCDTYHYTDNLIVEISDAVKASEVDWASNIVFSRRADEKNGTVSGIDVTTITMYVDIDNPSDERISAYIKNFYINSEAHAQASLVGNDYNYPEWIDPQESGSVYNITSGPVISATGVSYIERLGMEIVILDKNDQQIFCDVIWLDL